MGAEASVASHSPTCFASVSSLPTSTHCTPISRIYRHTCVSHKCDVRMEPHDSQQREAASHAGAHQSAPSYISSAALAHVSRIRKGPTLVLACAIHIAHTHQLTHSPKRPTPDRPGIQAWPGARAIYSARGRTTRTPRARARISKAHTHTHHCHVPLCPVERLTVASPPA